MRTARRPADRGGTPKATGGESGGKSCGGLSSCPAGGRLRLSYRLALRAAVASGAKAYGFTLVIWTTGALLASQHGLPRAGEAFAYLGGALAGMAAIILASFGGWRAAWSDVGLVRRAYGAIHAVSVLAAVLVGWLASAVLSGAVAFLVASFGAVVTYNLLLALEVALSIADIEDPSMATSEVASSG